LINEQIDWKQRFFIPTDEETGIATLTNLLTRYPVIVAEPCQHETIDLTQHGELGPVNIIDLSSWIIPAGSSIEPLIALATPTPEQVAFFHHAAQMTLWDAIPKAA
jgi:hypothetical protein